MIKNAIVIFFIYYDETNPKMTYNLGGEGDIGNVPLNIFFAGFRITGVLVFPF